MRYITTNQNWRKNHRTSVKLVMAKPFLYGGAKAQNYNHGKYTKINSN